MQAFIQQARPLYGDLVAPASVVDITISRDGIPHNMQLKEKASRFSGAQAVGFDLRMEVGGVREIFSAKSGVFSVNRSWGCIVPFGFSGSAYSHSVREISAFWVGGSSVMIGDIINKPPAVLVVAQVIGGLSVIQGAMLCGSASKWELNPASHTSYMRSYTVRGVVSQLKVFDVAELQGVGHTRGIQVGALIMIELDPSFAGRSVSSQSGACNILDIKGSISGVGYEFVSFS
jgi:hypothetical protein